MSDTPKLTLKELQPFLEGLLAELGYKLNEHYQFVKTDAYGLSIIKSIDDVAFELYVFKQENELPGLTKTMIMDYLSWYLNDYPQRKLIEHRQVIKYDPSAIRRTRTLADAVAGKGHNPLYDVVFDQIGYCIKMRMFGKAPQYPLWLNISGPDGVGKSKFVERWMSSIIPAHYIERPQSTAEGSVLNNLEKNGYLFIERYAIIFGELLGASDVAIDNIKNLVDVGSINFRGYYGQSSRSGQNIAQLISTSNKHLKDKFQRDDAIRKYCDIPFVSSDTQEELAERWKVINDFDYLEWMRSIDENGDEPLVKHYKAFLA